MKDLLECPLCGGNHPFVVETITDDRPWEVMCECGCHAGHFLTEEEAVNRWNTRAIPDNPPLTEEQIRAMVGKWMWVEDYVIPEHSGWDKITQLIDDPVEGDIIMFRHTHGASLEWIGNNYDIYAHEPKKEENK